MGVKFIGGGREREVGWGRGGEGVGAGLRGGGVGEAGDDSCATHVTWYFSP